MLVYRLELYISKMLVSFDLRGLYLNLLLPQQSARVRARLSTRQINGLFFLVRPPRARAICIISSLAKIDSASRVCEYNVGKRFMRASKNVTLYRALDFFPFISSAHSRASHSTIYILD